MTPLDEERGPRQRAASPRSATTPDRDDSSGTCPRCSSQYADTYGVCVRCGLRFAPDYLPVAATIVVWIGRRSFLFGAVLALPEPVMELVA